jgi:hypothetical protein
MMATMNSVVFVKLWYCNDGKSRLGSLTTDLEQEFVEDD